MIPVDAMRCINSSSIEVVNYLLRIDRRVVTYFMDWRLVHMMNQIRVKSAGTFISRNDFITLVFRTIFFPNARSIAVLAMISPPILLRLIPIGRISTLNYTQSWNAPSSIDLADDGRNKASKARQKLKASNPMYSSVMESRVNRRA